MSYCSRLRDADLRAVARAPALARLHCGSCKGLTTVASLAARARPLRWLCIDDCARVCGESVAAVRAAMMRRPPQPPRRPHGLDLARQPRGGAAAGGSGGTSDDDDGDTGPTGVRWERTDWADWR